MTSYICRVQRNRIESFKVIYLEYRETESIDDTLFTWSSCTHKQRLRVLYVECAETFFFKFIDDALVI